VLKARIVTATVILPLFLAALLYSTPVFWMALLLSLTVTGAREWSRLGGFTVGMTAVYLILTALIGGELLFILYRADAYTPVFLWFYSASFIFWILFVPVLLKSGHPIKNRFLYALTGWLVLLPTCLAIYQLRSVSPHILLGFMATIWISDTAAYFSGRAWGKHRLAPSISPGKTWEGAAGALFAVTLYALAWSALTSAEIPAWVLVPLLLLLVILGIIGDLFESLMKRHAGLKDSGNILPGHGGILDRIDALTSTLPVAALALLVFNI
jgi:phosphatidate cytidylyltransferase